MKLLFQVSEKRFILAYGVRGFNSWLFGLVVLGPETRQYIIAEVCVKGK
jgi:hypothetical protein